ncbi:MAG: polysaccharide biosynthesis/export family protein [Desulfomonilaceae bacterium]|nr:polysaccharide biosynthesis/export family protein [Desulfomonilaceae bacterium]
MVVRTLKTWGIWVLSCILLCSCIGLVPSPFRPSPGPQKTPQIEDLAEAFDIVCRNFRIGPGDQLRILYQAQWNIPAGSYRLDTLDRIQVKFLFDPELNEEVTIAPDGIITLQGIGDIRAAGLTRQELGDRIEKKLLESKIFSADKIGQGLAGYRIVTVHLVEFYGKVNKLIDALRSLTGGTQQGVTVKPDGTIDLPLLKETVLCAGHTISEVEQTVNRLYRRGVLKHVDVSIALVEANSRKVYVLGEVQSPGAYAIEQPITALHAIALAGGHNADTADLTSVILVSKNIHGKPIGRRLDLKRILDVGDMTPAILVKPYDVIYVPKTYIRDVRVFMEQYLTTVADVNALVKALK